MTKFILFSLIAAGVLNSAYAGGDSFPEPDSSIAPSSTATTNSPSSLSTTTLKPSTTITVSPPKKPSICARTEDVFDNQGQYVKTLCHVTRLLNHFEAEKNCEHNGMKLASSTEHVSQTTAFALTAAAGVGFIWTDGKVGQSCSYLISSAGAGYAFSSFACCPYYHSFCEYNKNVPYVERPELQFISYKRTVPAKHVSCLSDDAQYDSNNNYIKNICTINAELTKDEAAARCSSIGMRLARTDDNEESECKIISRANGEFTKELNVWIDGSLNGQCASVTHRATRQFSKVSTPCANKNLVYCEYGGKP